MFEGRLSLEIIYTRGLEYVIYNLDFKNEGTSLHGVILSVG